MAFGVSGKSSGTVRGPAAGLLVAIGLLILFGGGCGVRRRMTIRSDPAGARVYVDDYEIGVTPVSHDFTYYGTRKIRLVKDGYQTLTVMQPIPSPWYEIPPLDFISENFVPGKITDRRNLSYRLVPQQVTLPDELLGRAETLRGQVRSPQTPTSPTPIAPPSGMGGQAVHPLPPSGR